MKLMTGIVGGGSVGMHVLSMLLRAGVPPTSIVLATRRPLHAAYETFRSLGVTVLRDAREVRAASTAT